MLTGDRRIRRHERPLLRRDVLRSLELLDGRCQIGKRLFDHADELRVLIGIGVAIAADGFVEERLVVIEYGLRAGRVCCLARRTSPVRASSKGDGSAVDTGVDHNGFDIGLELIERQEFVELAVRRLHRPHVRGQAIGRPREERGDASEHKPEAEQQFVAQTPSTGHREPPCSGRRIRLWTASPFPWQYSPPNRRAQEYQKISYNGRATFTLRARVILTTAQIASFPRLPDLPPRPERARISMPARRVVHDCPRSWTTFATVKRLRIAAGSRSGRSDRPRFTERNSCAGSPCAA